MDVTETKLSLGPLLFNWDKDKARDFYFAIADEAPVDIVHVGEVVCSKRMPFQDWLPDVIDRLERGGKKVILSTLILIMNDREERAMKDIAASPDYLVEANDLAAISALRGRPHAIGPFINIYNEASLKYFEDGGAERITLPFELPKPSLEMLARAARAELEVQVFGRLPLAISARCYHARSHNLHKDNCQYVCGKDADGRAVDTLDGQHFLAINGLQTLSHSYVNLIRELDEMAHMGIGSFRLSPHDTDMVKVCRIFRDRMDGALDGDAAVAALEDTIITADFSNGYYHQKAGLKQVDP
ncbi:ubiquinone anaerobic biosynthesis protein UbiV [Luteithermobacter gelatinilyticus]|uniref:ubiquinone anaerobic biosynthesis protein UbiV n=1 Tax=Luteithermobacter gelatinilyticus TaxID=2582913 RepID=UPI001105B783|nr:U32 family peptidase [Luteithermobacter gelatinilyticus]